MIVTIYVAVDFSSVLHCSSISYFNQYITSRISFRMQCMIHCNVLFDLVMLMIVMLLLPVHFYMLE